MLNKRRVTIFINAGTATNAKIVSAERQTSISAYIEGLIQKDVRSEAVKRALKKRLEKLGGE